MVETEEGRADAISLDGGACVSAEVSAGVLVIRACAPDGMAVALSVDGGDPVTVTGEPRGRHRRREGA